MAVLSSNSGISVVELDSLVHLQLHESVRHFAQSRGWQTKAQAHLLCPVVYSYTGKQPHQPVYVWSVVTFALYQQSCVIATGSTWPIKLKILSDLCQKKFVSLSLELCSVL